MKQKDVLKLIDSLAYAIGQIADMHNFEPHSTETAARYANAKGWVKDVRDKIKKGNKK